MSIKHGSTTIKLINTVTGTGLSSGPVHIYHDMTWVFDERCIRFYSSSSFTIKLANSSGSASWDGKIQATVNPSSSIASSWNDYTAGTEITAKQVTFSDGTSRYEVSFRGVGNTRLATGTADSNSSTFTITGTDVYCEGDLLYLLDYSASTSYSAASCAYSRLFYNCTVLKSAPKMSLATIPSYCYYYTYYSCTRLTTFPKLSYTSLSSSGTYHCAYMFYNCTGLTNTPIMPILSSFPDHCYYNMFGYCGNLKGTPSIMPDNKSVTLANYCFAYMFQYCTSLADATFTNLTTLGGSQGTLGSGSTLGDYCLAFMFQNCPALKYATKLNSSGIGSATVYRIVKLAPTSLKSNCYRRMYYNCSSLKFSTTQTTTTDGKYSHAYRIPASGTAVGTTTNATYQMLTGTGGTYTGTPTLETTYYGFVSNS